MNKKTNTSSSKSTRTARQYSVQKDHTKHSVNLSQALTHPLFSPAAFPASHSAKPEEGLERQMTATSGLRCLELFDIKNRNGSSLKTCVASLLGTKEWYSSKCALIWKAQATKSSRLLFLLSPSTRLTDVTGYGLLPTARASEGEGGIVKNVVLNNGSYGRKNKKGIRHGVKVQNVIGMLPTAQARDWKGGARKGRDQLDSVIEMGASKGQTGEKTGMKLQPAFVEWMMGFPQGWTDLSSPLRRTAKRASRRWATQSSHK